MSEEGPVSLSDFINESPGIDQDDIPTAVQNRLSETLSELDTDYAVESPGDEVDASPTPFFSIEGPTNGVPIQSAEEFGDKTFTIRNNGTSDVQYTASIDSEPIDGGPISVGGSAEFTVSFAQDNAFRRELKVTADPGDGGGFSSVEVTRNLFADLSNGDFDDLKGAVLSGAVLASADLLDADLTDANLSNTNLSNADVGPNAQFSNANLSKVDLSGVTLKGGVLDGVDLSDADLSDADLSDADLSGADFTDADLSNTNFTNATLTGANPGDANNTSSADFSGTSFDS
jgi:hypothetical protein